MTGIRVLAFGTWDRGEGYPRGTSLLEGLRGQGVEVSECHVPTPYAGADKRRLLRSPWLWPGYWLSLRRVQRQAQRQLRRAIDVARPDLLLVPYPGHVVVHWARRVWRGPLVLDLFLSAHDTAVVDRQMFRPGSLLARLMRRFDRRAAACADAVLLDTAQNADHVAQLTGVARQRFHVVPVADPGEAEEPEAYAPPGVGEKLELLFFGTGVPLHGLGHLLDALAECEGVRLTLIGGSRADRQRASSMPSHKVRMAPEFVTDGELRQRLARAHLVAGVFGASPKTARVVPLKVMMALAAGRPVITGATPAIGDFLLQGAECVTVPVADGRALGRALQCLADSPEQLVSLAEAARRAYQREFSLASIGGRLHSICDEVRAAVQAVQARASVAVVTRSSLGELADAAGAAAGERSGRQPVLQGRQEPVR